MPYNMSKEELLEKLQNFIATVINDNRVIAVYLFGSYAAGRSTPLSDIDVAVLFDKSLEPKCYLYNKLHLLGQLSCILKTDKIDLMILNEAPPALGYRVIRDGGLVYLKEEAKGQLVEFKTRTLNRYFDYLPAQKIFSEGLAKRLREGRFGG